MTQDEAKAKWCPFGRIGHRSGVTLNDPDLAGTEYAKNLPSTRGVKGLDDAQR